MSGAQAWRTLACGTQNSTALETYLYLTSQDDRKHLLFAVETISDGNTSIHPCRQKKQSLLAANGNSMIVVWRGGGGGGVIPMLIHPECALCVSLSRQRFLSFPSARLIDARYTANKRRIYQDAKRRTPPNQPLVVLFLPNQSAGLHKTTKQA